MSRLSPFQKLPLHIAEAIGRYHIGLQRHTAGPVEYYLAYKKRKREEARKAWLVLHDVSYTWRILALEQLFREVSLKLTTIIDQSTFISTITLEDVTENYLEICPYVKAFNIEIDNIVERPNEEQFQTLKQVWPRDLVFPKVLSLSLRIIYLRGAVGIGSADKDAYFTWVIQRIRSSLPNLQNATLLNFDGTRLSIRPTTLFPGKWESGLFSAELLRLFNRQPHVNPNPDFMIPSTFIHTAPELTGFNCGNKMDSEFARWVIKMEAVTLESLDFGDCTPETFKAIMFDSNGQLTLFPRLKELKVDMKTDETGFETEKTLAPFPILRRLSLHSSYIFNDDTIFRGNSDTLVDLDIALGTLCVGVFQKHKAFSEGNYLQLRHVTVALADDDDDYNALSAEDFTQSAFSLISSATQTLTIDACISYKHIMGVIPTCSFVDNIQILYLPRVKLSLLEMFNMITYLPNMSDFCCLLREIDSELDIKQGIGIANQLYPQFYPLSHRLKCWHVDFIHEGAFEPIAVSAATLAVMCPSLTFVDLCSVRDRRLNEIRDILVSCLQDKFGERIKRLFDRH